ncbi:MAG: ATP-dependent 6-phosphofructokinase [Dehalococcoidia bacterium]|nr:ATP-dependent 6-phosphofructokinase [Dehalococcoidia bacterium]
MKKNRTIAILTGGGDCPGINAAIRGVAKKAILKYGARIIGFEDGYHGLVRNRYRELDYDTVSGILTLGGTILGTSKTANPYKYATRKGDALEFPDVSDTALRNFRETGAECLVCIGGDGTMAVASRLSRDGIPIIGIPKTIDNDLRGTDVTFGFDSAVWIATEGIDRLHSTADSHQRVMIVEVMGNTAGWLALHSGVAGGADVILIPEIPYDSDRVADAVLARRKMGRRFSIIAISEGSRPVGGDIVVKRMVQESFDPIRFGGIGFVLGREIEEKTSISTRTVVLGHLQRGGTPTPYDRVLATGLGTRAVDLIERGEFGCMVAVKGNGLGEVSLEEVAQGPRTVPADHPLIQTARDVGTSFGD